MIHKKGDVVWIRASSPPLSHQEIGKFSISHYADGDSGCFSGGVHGVYRFHGSDDWYIVEWSDYIEDDRREDDEGNELQPLDIIDGPFLSAEAALVVRRLAEAA